MEKFCAKIVRSALIGTKCPGLVGSKSTFSPGALTHRPLCCTMTLFPSLDFAFPALAMRKAPEHLPWWPGGVSISPGISPQATDVIVHPSQKPRSGIGTTAGFYHLCGQHLVA